MAVSCLTVDPLPRRGVRKVLVCFTGAALGYCDYLVARDRADGKRANRSEVIRRALRARQVLRHDLKATAGNLLLLRELLLSDKPPTNVELADLVLALHEQLERLTDPPDPEPLAGHLYGAAVSNS